MGALPSTHILTDRGPHCTDHATKLHYRRLGLAAPRGGEFSSKHNFYYFLKLLPNNVRTQFLRLSFQDGTFSYADFAEAFQEIEVKRVIRAYENGISIDIHCSPEGEWTKLPKENFTKACKVRINPTDVLTSGTRAITDFNNYLSPFLIPASLENLLESSDVVGNIRFSRPTLYIFPGGQGKICLFYSAVSIQRFQTLC